MDALSLAEQRASRFLLYCFVCAKILCVALDQVENADAAVVAILSGPADMSVYSTAENKHTHI